MKHTLLIITLLVFLGCEKIDRMNIDYSNEEYLKQLSFFKKEFVDHFPIKILEENMPFRFRGIVYSQYECVSMELDITYNNEYIKDLIDSISSISAAVYYSKDTCLLVVNRFHTEDQYWETIQLTENTRRLINRECYKGKLPVQNFYSSRLATYETDYQLPKDFTLYVLDAKKGKYWDDQYLYGGKYMPPEWEHGYSKGIAISEKSNIAVYWFVIW